MKELTPLTPFELLRLRSRLLAGLATGGVVTFPIDDCRRMMLAAPDVFYQADRFSITQATGFVDELALEGSTVHAALNLIAAAQLDLAGPWPAIIEAEKEAAQILAARIAKAPPMADPGAYTPRRADLSGNRPHSD